MSRCTVALALAIALGLFLTTHADEPAHVNINADIIGRLDAIMRRLDAIEQRLTKLEQTRRMSTRSWVDDHGVIRCHCGRPIGHWGIDGTEMFEEGL